MIGMTDWSGIHEDKGFKISYLPLSLLSLFYSAGVRLWLINKKGKKKLCLPGITISIGNLIAGGTGKTPATCMMAEWAIGEGYTVAILSKGYGGTNKAEVSIVSDGSKILAGPREVGDEPYLLAGRLPGVPVITAKNRYLAGMEAHNKFGSSLFILDDGYQHLRLKRDLDLLLLDATKPFGNGRLLPRGPLREPVKEVARADSVILTRAALSENKTVIRDDLREIFQGKPIFLSDHLPDRVVYPFADKTYDPSFLKGRRIVAFSGIAKPVFFRDTLLNLGVEILSFRSFPDHHPFTLNEIGSLISERDNLGAEFVITTEKDWTRVSDLVSGDHLIYYLTIRFDILSGQGRFFQMVKEKISMI